MKEKKSSKGWGGNQIAYLPWISIVFRIAGNSAKPVLNFEISHNSEGMNQVLASTFSVLAVLASFLSYHFIVLVHICSSNKNITRVQVLILKMKPKIR